MILYQLQQTKHLSFIVVKKMGKNALKQEVNLKCVICFRQQFCSGRFDMEHKSKQRPTMLYICNQVGLCHSEITIMMRDVDYLLAARSGRLIIHCIRESNSPLNMTVSSAHFFFMISESLL